MTRFCRALIACCLLTASAAIAQESSPWKTDYKAGGGGIFWTSPDENIKIQLQGFAQAVQKFYISDFYRKQRPDYPVAFSVRRARLSFGATFFKDHTLYVEYDGAPTTNATPGSESGFGMVEAHTTHRLLEDYLVLRMGKFILPFSAENYRSSRSSDTVERFMVVSSLFSLPALDSQYGVMAMGKALNNNSLAWYLAAVNGNAKASANTAETNNDKEYTVRINYDLYNDTAAQRQLTVGAAYDNANELPQTLKLSDHVGGEYNRVAVRGARNGYDADILFVHGPLSVRAEYLHARWNNAPGTPSIYGGMLQTGYFLNGSDKGGFQLLVRGESARLGGPITTSKANQLSAATVGWQWFLNANVRHQFNVIATSPCGGAGVYADNKTGFAALSQMQIKF
jgi:phosphate-selective porin